MSGGWAVIGRKTSEAWCGPERSDYTARRFPPEGLGLDSQGVADPDFENSSQPKAVIRKGKNGVWVGAQRRPFASPETG